MVPEPVLLRVRRENNGNSASCIMMSLNSLRVKFFTLVNPDVNEILRRSKGYQNTDSVCSKMDSAALIEVIYKLTSLIYVQHVTKV